MRGHVRRNISSVHARSTVERRGSLGKEPHFRRSAYQDSLRLGLRRRGRCKRVGVSEDVEGSRSDTKGQGERRGKLTVKWERVS